MLSLGRGSMVCEATAAPCSLSLAASGLQREIPCELERSPGDPNALPGLLRTWKTPKHCEESSAFAKTSAPARAGLGCDHHLQKPLPNNPQREKNHENPPDQNWGQQQNIT